MDALTELPLTPLRSLERRTERFETTVELPRERRRPSDRRRSRLVPVSTETSRAIRAGIGSLRSRTVGSTVRSERCVPSTSLHASVVPEVDARGVRRGEAEAIEAGPHGGSNVVPRVGRPVRDPVPVPTHEQDTLLQEHYDWTGGPIDVAVEFLVESSVINFQSSVRNTQSRPSPTTKVT